jgi:hypothetical protein
MQVHVETKKTVQVYIDRGTTFGEFDVQGLEEASKIISALIQPEAFGIPALIAAMSEQGSKWVDLPTPVRCSCGWVADQGGDTSLAGAREADAADTPRSAPSDRLEMADIEAVADRHADILGDLGAPTA